MGTALVRLLGISGSPREASTAFVIQEGLKYAAKMFNAQTEYFSLQNKDIKFCIHCDYCVREKKGCVHEDAMVEAYDKMEKADTFIIGTPVYNGSISGQLKMFLDRCRALVAKNPRALENKVGAGVAVGGDRLGGQGGCRRTGSPLGFISARAFTTEQILKFFLRHNRKGSGDS